MKNGRVIAVPDCHVPFHDKRAWNLCLDIIQDQKPDAVVQLGDFSDSQAFSAHPKSFGYKPDPERDLEAVRQAAKDLRTVSRNRTKFLLGNHDIWLQRYMARNAPLAESVIPDYAELFGYGHDPVAYQEPHYIGRVAYVHDVGFSGVNATRQTLDAVGHCVVHGHDHRGTVVYNGTTDRDRWFGMGCGWLGDVSKITYMAPARTRQWQLGIGDIVYRDGLAFAQFVPFVRGKAFVNGKVYK